MLGNEGDQQEKDCYHGDEDASRDPRSVETRPHEKRGNPAHSTHFTDRRGYALWPSSLVWTCPETRCGQCHSQSDEPGHTWYQTTRTPQEDVEPTTEGRHDGRGCDPGYGPRPDGVETEDKADPYEIGKRPLKVSKVSISGRNVSFLIEFGTTFLRVLTCFNGCAAAMDARLGFGTRLRWFCDRGVW